MDNEKETELSASEAEASAEPQEENVPAADETEPDEIDLAEMFPDMSAEEINALRDKVDTDSESAGSQEEEPVKPETEKKTIPETVPEQTPEKGVKPEETVTETPPPAAEEPKAAEESPVSRLALKVLEAMGVKGNVEDLVKTYADYAMVSEEQARKDLEREGILPSASAPAPAPEKKPETASSAAPAVSKAEDANKGQLNDDLSAIQNAYPAYRGLTDLRQLPDFGKFAALRYAGVSAVEAAGIVSGLGYVKVSEDDGKSHLRSTVPVERAGSNETRLSDRQVSELRETLFGGDPNISDKEIRDLYRRANK